MKSPSDKSEMIKWIPTSIILALIVIGLIFFIDVTKSPEGELLVLFLYVYYVALIFILSIIHILFLKKRKDQLQILILNTIGLFGFPMWFLSQNILEAVIVLLIYIIPYAIAVALSFGISRVIQKSCQRFRGDIK